MGGENRYIKKYLKQQQKAAEKEAKLTYQIEPRNDKTFKIFYIIFIIMLCIITIFCISSTIKNLTLDEEKLDDTIIGNEKNTKEKKSNDKKYAIKAYTETYDSNSLKTDKYYNIEGKTITEDEYNQNVSQYENKNIVAFVQIDGLKDKDIQKKVNEKIKLKAYELKGKFIDTYVISSFSNMISMQFTNENNQIDTLNIDLSTGNDITLNEIFLSSAPINSYLEDALYKTLAWQSLSFDEDEGYQNDMDKVDTSEYEDKFMMLINKYNKDKENLKFTINSNKINIYGLLDKKILDVKEVDTFPITIDLINYIDKVAMYKRFLTNDSIFEDNSLGVKGTIVFTGDKEKEDYLTRLNYGKFTDNIFMEEVLFEGINNEVDTKVAKEYINKLSGEQKVNLINEKSNDIGIFYQCQYEINYDTEKKYFVISQYYSTVKCRNDYFKNEAFLDFIKLEAIPVPNISINLFSNYIEEFPNFIVISAENKFYYINEEGELLGNSEEEVEAKLLEEKQKEEELQRLQQEQQQLQQQLQQQQRQQQQTQTQQNNVLENNSSYSITNGNSGSSSSGTSQGGTQQSSNTTSGGNTNTGGNSNTTSGSGNTTTNTVVNNTIY